LRRNRLGSLPRKRGKGQERAPRLLWLPPPRAGRVGGGHRSTGTGMPRRGPGGPHPGPPASGGRGGSAARLLWLPPPRAGGGRGRGCAREGQAPPIAAPPRGGGGGGARRGFLGSLPRVRGGGGGGASGQPDKAAQAPPKRPPPRPSPASGGRGSGLRPTASA